MSKVSGAEWIKAALSVREMSPLGEAVANLLDNVFVGIYHLDDNKLRKVDWGDTYVVCVQLSCQSLSNFDNNNLTKLVVLAHDYCLRLDISARTVRTLELMFHARQRQGDLMRRMPTMEQHLEIIRRYYPAKDE